MERWGEPRGNLKTIFKSYFLGTYVLKDLGKACSSKICGFEVAMSPISANLEQTRRVFSQV